MKLSKSWIIGIVVIGIVLISIFSAIRMYNKMPGLEEGVNSQWAKVESAYQRRSDLIPNLVNTVKGVANFEQQTLTAVVEARAKATAVNIKPENLNAESIKSLCIYEHLFILSILQNLRGFSPLIYIIPSPLHGASKRILSK